MLLFISEKPHKLPKCGDMAEQVISNLHLGLGRASVRVRSLSVANNRIHSSQCKQKALIESPGESGDDTSRLWNLKPHPNYQCPSTQQRFWAQWPLGTVASACTSQDTNKTPLFMPFPSDQAKSLMHLHVHLSFSWREVSCMSTWPVKYKSHVCTLASRKTGKACC